MSEPIRDLYKDESLQYDAFGFAESNFPSFIFNSLCGEDDDGRAVAQQNIVSLLNQIEDLGKYTAEEWKLFFETIRVEGI